MTIADEAITNALPCELVKYALRQSKDGIVISFVVHPNDIPAALQTSHIGSRWMAALVQIGDDERPIPPTEKEKSTPATNDPATSRPVSDKPRAGTKRDWNDLQPQQQAGMRCGEPSFVAFLKECRPDDWAEATDAAECVRLICGVHSRVELGTKQAARVIWHQLDTQYQAWKVMEHA